MAAGEMRGDEDAVLPERHVGILEIGIVALRGRQERVAPLVLEDLLLERLGERRRVDHEVERVRMRRRQRHAGGQHAGKGFRIHRERVGMRIHPVVDIG